MRAGQRKTRASMLGDAKRRAVEIHDCVAAFALVVVGRGGELIVVGIFVAIAAGRKLYFVNRFLPRRDMALGALDLDVFALQGITRIVVFLHAEEGWLPAVQVVAFGAFAFLWAGLKLALVRIRLVAVVAVREWDLLFEIAVDVARHAGNLRVLSDERIFRFRVVEIIPRQHRLPAAGGMAGLAGFLELSRVRINVAGGAGVEFHVAIPRRPSRQIRLVTFFAGNLYMQAGERIPRF